MLNRGTEFAKLAIFIYILICIYLQINIHMHIHTYAHIKSHFTPDCLIKQSFMHSYTQTAIHWAIFYVFEYIHKHFLAFMQTYIYKMYMNKYIHQTTFIFICKKPCWLRHGRLCMLMGTLTLIHCNTHPLSFAHFRCRLLTFSPLCLSQMRYTMLD